MNAFGVDAPIKYALWPTLALKNQASCGAGRLPKHNKRLGALTGNLALNTPYERCKPPQKLFTDTCVANQAIQVAPSTSQLQLTALAVPVATGARGVEGPDASACDLSQLGSRAIQGSEEPRSCPPHAKPKPLYNPQIKKSIPYIGRWTLRMIQSPVPCSRT